MNQENQSASNISIAIKPRKTPDKIPDTYCKYKDLNFKNCNFLEVVDEAIKNLSPDDQEVFLLSKNFHELERCYRIPSEDRKKDHAANSLSFKGCTNSQIVDELARFAQMFPNFVLEKGEIEYTSLDRESFEGSIYSVEINIKDSKVNVLLEY